MIEIVKLPIVLKYSKVTITFVNIESNAEMYFSQLIFSYPKYEI